jgi:hypothetical protein
MILTAAGLAISKVAKSLSLITVPLIPALLTCIEQVFFLNEKYL